MSLGSDVLSDIRQRFSLDAIGMSMTDWASKHTTIKGRPFSVRGYEFQRAIMDDFHPNMDVIKCSQVGLTEVQIRKALGFAVRNQGRSLLFTLPDEKLYTKVSQTRFKPTIDDDAIFNQERDAGATRSKEIKQFGRSFVYITGCTESDATSTSADAIFNDEVDLSPQDMLALFNSRLQNSDLKISQRFSTPSFPGFGIDLGFQSSDQNLYMCKCERCNFYNWPQFNRDSCHIPGLPDHLAKLTDLSQQIIDEHGIVLADSYVKCINCDAQLDLGNPELREWVPRFQKRSKDARGYYVTPFSTARIDLPYILRQLLDYKRRDYMRGFHNTVLGETYVNGDIRLEEDVIKACFDRTSPSIPDVSKDTPVAVGIDMGLVCHVTVSLLSGAVFLFAAVPSSEIEDFVQKLCDKYKVVAGGVDRFPYTPTAENIWAISKGCILPLEYHERGREITTVKDAYGTITHGQINRTMGLDKVANMVRNRNISFAGYGFYEQTIIEHLRDQVRDEQPEKPAVWKKLTGRDHFHHSLAFLFMGMELRDLIRSIEMEGVQTEIAWGVAKLQLPVSTSLFNPMGNSKVAKRRDKVYQRH